MKVLLAVELRMCWVAEGMQSRRMWHSTGWCDGDLGLISES